MSLAGLVLFRRYRRPSGGGAHPGGEAVAQLLIRTDDPDEIVASASFQLTGDAWHLLPVLFPGQNPQPSLVDLA
jgi:hypothetical protein